MKKFLELVLFDFLRGCTVLFVSTSSSSPCIMNLSWLDAWLLQQPTGAMTPYVFPKTPCPSLSTIIDLPPLAPSQYMQL